MDIACPECDRALESLSGDEMGSGTRRLRCVECCLLYETGPFGLIREIDD